MRLVTKYIQTAGTLLMAVTLLACWPSNARAAWTVRHAMLAETENGRELMPRNVDVMVSRYAGIRLGYALPGIDTGYLSTPAGDGWQHEQLASPMRVGSFQMDAYGLVTWAGYRPVTTTIGVDLDAFGGIVESQHPGNLSEATTLALDRQGGPAIVGVDIQSQQRVVSRFSIQSGEWEDQPANVYGDQYSITQGFTSSYALTFLDDNRAVVGYFDGLDLVIAVEDPVLGTRNLATSAPVESLGQWEYGVSIATAPTGEVAFAYVQGPSGLTVGVYDGNSTTYEVVSSDSCYLTPRSLAYDPITGQFHLAYAPDATLDPGGAQPLHIARRDSTGTWAAKMLPTHAIHASLMFDDDGNVLVGAVTPDYITLITNAPDVMPGLQGDLNVDGFVGLDDLDRLLVRWNQSVSPGSAPDPSYDGYVGLDDLDIILTNWNAGTPPGGSAIPEPGTLSLLLLIGLLASLHQDRDRMKRL